MFRTAIALRSRRMAPDKILAHLKVVNQEMCQPPLLNNELAKIVESVVKGGRQTVVHELNQHLAFLLHGSKATVLSVSPDPDFPGTEQVTLARVQDMQQKYANQYLEITDEEGKVSRKPKFDIWMHDKSRREVRRLTLMPGAKSGYDPTTGDFNLWQGWGVVPHEPDSEHSWKRLRIHIKQIVANGNKKHAAYILNWLAYCVKNPARRPEVALVLIGCEGAGKGILLNTMVHLFGRHGLRLDKKEQLTGKHNRHLQDAVFVFADEAFFAGDPSAIGPLKGMITEKSLQIEPKFVDSYSLPNYRKFAMSSNETWVVNADLEARRYAVFHVSDARTGDRQYFKAIMDDLEHGGCEAMLHDLLNRDLADFEVRDFPQTKALLDQKKLSWDDVTAWYFERLREGKLQERDAKWTSVIARDSVETAILNRMHSKDRYNTKGLETKIGLQLQKLTGKKLEESRSTVDGRRVRMHVFPSLIECRKLFESVLKMSPGTINWETGDIEEAQ
jgi:hypothetical protein